VARTARDLAGVPVRRAVPLRPPAAGLLVPALAVLAVGLAPRASQPSGEPRSLLAPRTTEVAVGDTTGPPTAETAPDAAPFDARIDDAAAPTTGGATSPPAGPPGDAVGPIDHGPASEPIAPGVASARALADASLEEMSLTADGRGLAGAPPTGPSAGDLRRGSGERGAGVPVAGVTTVAGTGAEAGRVAATLRFDEAAQPRALAGGAAVWTLPGSGDAVARARGTGRIDPGRRLTGAERRLVEAYFLKLEEVERGRAARAIEEDRP
jgi:hypothetical protein